MPGSFQVFALLPLWHHCPLCPVGHFSEKEQELVRKCEAYRRLSVDSDSSLNLGRRDSDSFSQVAKQHADYQAYGEDMIRGIDCVVQVRFLFLYV